MSMQGTCLPFSALITGLVSLIKNWKFAEVIKAKRGGGEKREKRANFISIRTCDDD